MNVQPILQRFKMKKRRFGVFPYALAGFYLAFSSFVFLHAIFSPSFDGGEWFTLYFAYWPISKITVTFREVLKNLCSSEVLHGFPSQKVSLLNLTDGGFAILLGSVWYYFIGVTIVVLSRKAIAIFQRK